MGADLYMMPAGLKVKDFTSRCLDAAMAVVQESEGKKDYFRDSYNDSSLFWKLKMSWWRDIGDKFCTKQGFLPPAKAKKVIRLLEEAAPVLRESISQLPIKSTDDSFDQEYFLEKYVRLHLFLVRAVEECRYIWCSV